MSGVDVYGQYGNVVSSMSGLEVINNNVAAMLDPSPNNDLIITSNGLLGNGLLITGMNSLQANLNVGNNKMINVATPTNSTDGCTKGYVDTTAIVTKLVKFNGGILQSCKCSRCSHKELC